jgi:hypothetical protein
VLSEVPPGVDPSTPSPARMYDYMLGGTLSLPVDRAAADRLKALVPDLLDGVWGNRGFHQRAAVWLAEHGISQFIDLGSGLPTQNNTHDAVHKVLPGAHVVYVDNDPVVAAYSSALLAGDGTTTLINADVCDPAAVLGNDALRALIDLSRPVGLLMTALLHFVADEADPWNVVRQYAAAIAPGSYLALSHFTADNMPPAQIEAGVIVYSGTATGIYPRSRDQVQRFFDGLDLVPPYDGAEPGLSHVGLWGAEDQQAADTDGARGLYCGVGRRG